MKREELLNKEIEHIDIKSFDSAEIINAFSKMAFQAKNLARSAHILEKMTENKDCSIILCLAGSIFSAGLKKVVYDMVKHNMVDAIVSTGAIIVDQEFFEALGFKHYQGTPFVDDEMLRKQNIDRIYDTYIDEDELRVCDMTIAEIADSLEPRPYSSREFIVAMGKYLLDNGAKAKDSVVLESYKKGVPIFVPAFSDCSAGFGLVYHQNAKGSKPKVTIDSAKDFLELTKIKIASKDTGLFMIGGGVPKNFAQDVPVAADILGKEVNMHKYAIQITVADERDGALSGSTLKEAHSWGKVESGNEQMVYAEATVAMPLIVSYAYHKGGWKKRRENRFNDFLK
ncbi:MAG TPA: deoxyhypusine synthase [Methanofastidiosum sp.]|nr:deoxyhypusine synthase [Methanofastidiosum sp.]HOR87878.1 deoxyhypusine synthase [Methanofastidiosum sp.]HOT84963.1 deoxyhypusine synthase [Methanofastidiosum sp.]HPL00186.1 deoxyhypusine synthase [Methanofastidiosum sp.]HQF89759.1 deoxyhypusine synthase [Methanofastidiosum sp.]